MVEKDMEGKRILEAACVGDTDAVQELIHFGADVNTQHSVNGWTPLHWACQKGFLDIAVLLLKNGADKSIRSFSGETAASLCNNPQILQLLASDVQKNIREPSIQHTQQSEYSISINDDSKRFCRGNHIQDEQRNRSFPQYELVLKIRIANAADPDFIEVELPTNSLTYQALIEVCCDEFNLCPHQILKLRKLPNTRLRKDKDVKRLDNFQEIEIVVDPVNVYRNAQYSNGAACNSLTTPANGYQSISKKDQTILY